MYINASTKRVLAFNRVQEQWIETLEVTVEAETASALDKGKKRKRRVLALLMDVKTRWDSPTYIMIWYRLLSTPIDIYLAETGIDWLRLSKDEIRKLDYIIELTKPFALCTSLIG